MSSSFKTYVDITEQGSEDYEWVINENDQPKLEPRLLPGEVIITSAENVLKFASVSNRKQGISGWLFVTNFKIAFVSPTSPVYSGNSKDDRNKLLGPYEICLANIDQVYQVNGDRKKKLTPGTAIVSNVKTLQIVCKDFSVHSFSFKFCPVGCHKTVINAILHHGFPKRIELLFTFECILPATQPIHGMQTFATADDWNYEVDRCNCNDSWRLCLANEQYKLSSSLPQAFVVPRSLVDAQILKASKHFMGNRPPFWCWGLRNCVIVRMASLYPFITDTQQESIILEHVRKSHPNLREPLILDLDKLMPLFSEIRASWCKLRDHCCSPVDNIQRFWEQDSKFGSFLNATRWPHHVCNCLRLANRVVDAITKHQISVVLQEGESRDTSAIISSLAQLIMDPYFRTIHGFQSLIQKEWVMLGHPFSLRFGRIADSEAKQAPLFQLFLDCVWQLQHQFPTSFELTETYLTSLWDSLHNTVFDTFSFDSQRDRQISVQDFESNSCDGGAPPGTPAVASRSVWEWELQFHDIDIGLFLNPLYSITSRVANHRQRRGLEVDVGPVTNPTVMPPQAARFQAHQGTFSDGHRPRRSSISNLTLTRKEFAEMAEYGGHEGTDTLGRNWGSRLGLAAIIGMDQPHASSLRTEGSSRWKKIRGALFHGHGRSFSPKTKISSIDEGLESTQYPEEPAVVTYRSTRSYADSANQRWTVYGDPSVAGEPPPQSTPIKLSPCPTPCSPVNCELNWDGNDVPFHELNWPVYTILPVADSLVSYRLWKQCYLRWIPILDIRGGGQPPIYFQHCSIVNEILSLEYLFYQLQNDEAAASPMQRFVTMSDQNASGPSMNQATLSSFHPFVQQQNDSALSFGEWEIVPSPVAFADRSDEAVGPSGPEFDSESVVTTSD